MSSSKVNLNGWRPIVRGTTEVLGITLLSFGCSGRTIGTKGDTQSSESEALPLSQYTYTVTTPVGYTALDATIATSGR